MGKHDKTIATSTEEFYQNKIKDLEKRLAFAEENNKKLRTELAKYNKWLNELHANAQNEANALRERIHKLEATIIRLAVR